MTKHTPTPWAVSDDGGPCIETEGGGRTVAILGEDPQMTEGEHKANAAHIVRCVNTHAALLAALKRIAVGTTFGNSTEPAWVLNTIALDAIALATPEAA